MAVSGFIEAVEANNERVHAGYIVGVLPPESRDLVGERKDDQLEVVLGHDCLSTRDVTIYKDTLPYAGEGRSRPPSGTSYRNAFA